MSNRFDRWIKLLLHLLQISTIAPTYCASTNCFTVPVFCTWQDFYFYPITVYPVDVFCFSKFKDFYFCASRHYCNNLWCCGFARAEFEVFWDEHCFVWDNVCYIFSALFGLLNVAKLTACSSLYFCKAVLTILWLLQQGLLSPYCAEDFSETRLQKSLLSKTFTTDLSDKSVINKKVRHLLHD